MRYVFYTKTVQAMNIDHEKIHNYFFRHENDIILIPKDSQKIDIHDKNIKKFKYSTKVKKQAPQ